MIGSDYKAQAVLLDFCHSKSDIDDQLDDLFSLVDEREKKESLRTTLNVSLQNLDLVKVDPQPANSPLIMNSLWFATREMRAVKEKRDSLVLLVASCLFFLMTVKSQLKIFDVSTHTEKEDFIWISYLLTMVPQVTILIMLAQKNLEAFATSFLDHINQPFLLKKFSSKRNEEKIQYILKKQMDLATREKRRQIVELQRQEIQAEDHRCSIKAIEQIKWDYNSKKLKKAVNAYAHFIGAKGVIKAKVFFHSVDYERLIENFREKKINLFSSLPVAKIRKISTKINNQIDQLSIGLRDKILAKLAEEGDLCPITRFPPILPVRLQLEAIREKTLFYDYDYLLEWLKTLRRASDEIMPLKCPITGYDITEDQLILDLSHVKRRLRIAYDAIHEQESSETFNVIIKKSS